MQSRNACWAAGSFAPAPAMPRRLGSLLADEPPLSVLPPLTDPAPPVAPAAEPLVVEPDPSEPEPIVLEEPPPIVPDPVAPVVEEPEPNDPEPDVVPDPAALPAPLLPPARGPGDALPPISCASRLH